MGTITVVGQLKVFGFSVLLGMAFCLLYDIFKGFRIKYLKSVVAVFLTDIIYWLVLFFFTHSFLLIFCNGRIRGYVLIGLFLGFVLCRLTVSRIFSKFILLLLSVCHKLLHWIFLPFFAFLSLLDKLFAKISEMFGKILKKIFKKRKKLLKEEQ